MRRICQTDGLIALGTDTRSVTPEGKFVEVIHAAQGQLEREQNGRQVIQKMQARLSKGYFVFHAPVGYRYEQTREHGKLLVPNEPYASIIREGFEGLASGRFQTLSEVMYFFEQLPEYPRGSDGRVKVQRVKETLNRPIYAGYIEHERWGISLRKGQHEPLVSLETFKKARDRLAGRAYVPAKKNISEDFPLRGFVTCADCGNPMTSSWCKGRSAKYPYYFCRKKGCESYGKSVKRDVVENEFAELLKAITPAKSALDAAAKMFDDIWKARSQHRRNYAQKIKNTLKDLDRTMDSVVDIMVNTSSPRARQGYENKLESLEQEKLVLEEKIRHFMAEQADQTQSVRTALEFLENPHKLWATGELANQRAVLKLVFSEPLAWKRNEGVRTAKTTLPFKYLDDFSYPRNGMVPGGGIEPPTRGFSIPCSTD